MQEVLEVLLRLVLAIVIETLIRSPGWLILRIFRKPEDIQPDGCLVLTVGILFWVVAGGLICAAFLL